MLNLKSEFTWTDEIIFENGHQLNEPKLLFAKVEDEQIEIQMDKLMVSKSSPITAEINPQKPECTFDDFQKLDIRVATILEAEKVPKADKLLKLLVDTGIDKRTVVSGIAEHFTPKDIIGKQVSILVNLAPRKIKGIESQGMILMAEDENGKLHFVAPKNYVNNGAEVR